MNEEDNKTLEYFKKVYDELIQDEKYQKYASLMDFYHKKIEDLQHQLEEKDKIIDEAIKFINSQKQYYDDGEYRGVYCTIDGFKLLEILERGKNEI